jgi:UDP-N-acetylglucosamine diphosphorylase/glucosamine-1-phosphate N-acetyltransferase
MHLILNDQSPWRVRFYPLTLTRPVSDLRVGICTIAQKWEKWLNTSLSFKTVPHLQALYANPIQGSTCLILQGNLLPTATLVDALQQMVLGDGLRNKDQVIAICVDVSGINDFERANQLDLRWKNFDEPLDQITYPEDLFLKNGDQIKADFTLLTEGRTSAEISSDNTIIGDQIFAEEGAKATCAILNSTQGPIYLGKNTEIWEGSLIRGPFALGEGAQVKMGTRSYPNVSIGPYSRVGGELNTCVIWGNSSKGHDGYMGNAVIGEWCNWGADTNNSNLKNNYKEVKIYDYSLQDYRDTQQQFCGIIMGDHAKCAINTAFNTGTVVGVGASVFGPGLQPTFIPDFAWGGSEGMVEHALDKMMDTSVRVYKRRNQVFDEKDAQRLEAVFHLTKAYRNF